MYRFVAVRTQEDDDGFLYPVFSAPEQRLVFELEPEDGSDIRHLVVSGINIREQSGANKPVLFVHDIKADLYITDARVVLCCEKYTKGGAFTGMGIGAVVALGALAVSAARAAHRRKGKMLAGHMRYSWLWQVGGLNRTSFASKETLRLVTKDGTRSQQPLLIADLWLAKSVDSTEVAQDIAQRSARYHLAHDDSLSEEPRASFDLLTHAARKESAKGSFGLQAMPIFQAVRPSNLSTPGGDGATESMQPTTGPESEGGDQ